jgi:hypothetical protein
MSSRARSTCNRCSCGWLETTSTWLLAVSLVMVKSREQVDLTDVEVRLVEAAWNGEVFRCSSLSPAELAVSDDRTYLIRAEVLRELLLGWRGEIDPRGVQVRGARLTGRFDLSYLQAQVGLALLECLVEEEVALREAQLPWLVIRATAISTLFGQGLRVEGSVFLDQGFTSVALGDDCAVSLAGAHIQGTLTLAGARLISKNGPALDADSLRVEGGLFLHDGFIARSHSVVGAVRLVGATIGQQFNASGAQITNSVGPALHADGARIEGSMFLDSGFTADGCGERSAVRLFGIQVRGDLRLDGARLANSTGPALGADRLSVGANLTLTEGFTAIGSSSSGAVRLLNAHIGGQFVGLGAELANGCGPALQGQGLRVGGDLFLQHGTAAAGGDPDDPAVCAVELNDAHIGGQLRLIGARLQNLHGPVLNLMNVHAGTVFLPVGLLCQRDADTANACDGVRRIRADGFTYTALRKISWQSWLHVLRRHTGGYRSQPYQHLATTEKAAGHEGNARRVLIAQQDDLRERGQMISRHAAVVHRVWGVLAGYGYRAGRLALVLVAVVALAGGLGWWAGHTVAAAGHHIVEHTPASGHPGTPCSSIEQIGVGIDRGLPLASTGIENRCELDTVSHTGQLFTLAMWLVQAVMWGLATLAVAGYTGLIRKIN